MSSSLDQSRAYWEAHARRDPLWAILSEPTRKNAGWDVDGFFQTGVAEVAAWLYELDSRGLHYGRDAALDFGCGVGRLTQALATHFDNVLGIDISPRMIELARQLNQHGERVSYIANAVRDLRVLGDRRFDVVITQVVLQHIEPELADRYVSEFFRVVRPGGLIVFQWPSHRRPPEDSAPAAPRVMPDTAYQMAIACTSPRRTFAPGETAALDVVITNASPLDWRRDVDGPISVGNHWIDASGRLIKRDDGRTALPSVGAGDDCNVSLAINVPREPGAYVCELDLAHEGVLWFGDRGARTARLAVQVVEQGQEAAARAVDPRTPTPPLVTVPSSREIDGVSLSAPDPGEFPMHGRSRSDVERLITAHAGTLLHVEPDCSCGTDWVSFRYYVRTSG